MVGNKMYLRILSSVSSVSGCFSLHLQFFIFTFQVFFLHISSSLHCISSLSSRFRLFIFTSPVVYLHILGCLSSHLRLFIFTFQIFFFTSPVLYITSLVYLHVFSCVSSYLWLFILISPIVYVYISNLLSSCVKLYYSASSVEMCNESLIYGTFFTLIWTQ